MTINKNRFERNGIFRDMERGFKSSNALNRKDYYDTLGVSRNSSQGDIKKAYFKLAKKYHPDVNKTEGAKAKFEEINEAYETLGDESKKRVYDTTGMSGDEQRQAGGDPFGGFGGSQGFSGFGGFEGFHD